MQNSALWYIHRLEDGTPNGAELKASCKISCTGLIPSNDHLLKGQEEEGEQWFLQEHERAVCLKRNKIEDSWPQRLHIRQYLGSKKGLPIMEQGGYPSSYF